MKRYADMISGGVILIFSAILFYATTQIRVISNMEGLTSKFFPRIIVGALFFLGTIIFIRGVLAARSSAAPEQPAEKTRKKLSPGALCAIETFAAILVYVILMEPVGFLISTGVYLFVQMLILAPAGQTWKNRALFVCIAVVASTGIYFLFTRVFYLLLPAGILG